MNRTDVDRRVFNGPKDLWEGAAEYIVQQAQNAKNLRGRFTWALSGGNTPKGLYRALATEPYSNRIDWATTYLFFTDERHVPPDHTQSNYRMAKNALISNMPIPNKNIFPIPTSGTLEKDAERYEKILRTFFAEEKPAFDLILLGLGTDGHTASLFPGSSAVNEKRAWVVSVRAAVQPANRITLTLPIINCSKQVMYLVSGKEKADMVAKVLSDYESNVSHLPATKVRLETGKVVWFMDQDATMK